MVEYIVRVAGKTFLSFRKQDDWHSVINYYKARFPNDVVDIERLPAAIPREKPNA